MAVVTVHSDFGAWENKVSIFSPSICHEVMGPDAMILLFWMLSFKPAFSLFFHLQTRGSLVPLCFLPLLLLLLLSCFSRVGFCATLLGWQPTRLPCPWDSPGKNAGVGCHSFSNAWKWKVKVKSLSCARLSATLWTAAYQAPPSMGFSRQEYWSGVPSSASSSPL